MISVLEVKGGTSATEGVWTMFVQIRPPGTQSDIPYVRNDFRGTQNDIRYVQYYFQGMQSDIDCRSRRTPWSALLA
jgi:hypothetical protein